MVLFQSLIHYLYICNHGYWYDCSFPPAGGRLWSCCWDRGAWQDGFPTHAISNICSSSLLSSWPEYLMFKWAAPLRLNPACLANLLERIDTPSTPRKEVKSSIPLVEVWNLDWSPQESFLRGRGLLHFYRVVLWHILMAFLVLSGYVNHLIIIYL